MPHEGTTPRLSEFAPWPRHHAKPFVVCSFCMLFVYVFQSVLHDFVASLFCRLCLFPGLFCIFLCALVLFCRLSVCMSFACFSDGQENIINLCEIVLGLGALTRRLGALTRALTRALMRQALVADCLTPSWPKLKRL